MSVPIYVLDRTPGATETVAWESICHAKRMVVVDYRPYRNESRWTWSVRKRPFVVTDRNLEMIWSTHATLDAAMKSARIYARIKESVE